MDLCEFSANGDLALAERVVNITQRRLDSIG
jgi:hypothetical protein